jgi:trehalose 6-phosphate synthase
LKLSLRFIIPLVLVLTALAYSVMPLVDKLTIQWFVRDLNLRATLVANTIDEQMYSLVAANDTPGIRRFFARITQDERLFAMGFCGTPEGKPVATTTLPREINCANLDSFSDPTGRVLSEAQGPLLISVKPIAPLGDTVGRIVLVQDMSFVGRRSAETKQYLFYFFIALGVVVSLITVAVAQLSWRGWVRGIQALIRGEGLLRPSQQSDEGELRPIADDLRTLIRDIEAEHRLRDEEQLAWTPDTLRGILDRELRGQ